MLLWCLKKILKTVVSLLIAFYVLLFAWSFAVSKLANLDGERTYYLYSASSQAAQKKALSFLDLGHIKGESVRLAYREGLVQELCAAYGAEVALTEEVGGIRSYYCITPDWADGVTVGGKRVNLHIAVRGEECVVGSPIIFGGY